MFKEKGMRTFGDWLRYYNNLDVAPGLEALEKMKSFYTERGIDILKDAVSLPGVSMHYVLRGAIERGADLYCPGREEYEMLKRAIVGGPSLVFTRYHEAGVTRIREHKFEEPRLCKKILGYDANALYPSTMLRAMPCGRGSVKYYSEERGVTLLSVIIKIFCRMLLKRIKRGVDKKLRNEQAGRFRSKRSTTEQICILRNILEQANEWRAGLYVHFVDFEKAFDSVHRESLWNIMKSYGIPHKMVRVIAGKYQGFECAVVDGSETSEWSKAGV